MNMSRDLIDQLLTSGKEKMQKDYRLLLEHCREPKEWGKVKEIKLKNDIFKVLTDLKKAGAIGFEDKKYFTTRKGLDVLKEI